MKKVFVVHGLGSAPDHAWRGWLVDELKNKNIAVENPQMPGDDNPICKEWVDLLNKIIDPKDENYIIGHSLGARAVLRYLEAGGRARGVILVSGRFGKPKSGTLGTFYNEPLDFSKIKNNSEKFVVFHGSNDPNIPFEDGKKISEELNCKFIVIENGGHLSGKAGFNKFPEVLDELLKMMK